MNWGQQQILILKLERRYSPVIAARINDILRRGLALYRDGRTGELSNVFFDEALYNVVAELQGKAGVSMARYVYKSMPKKRELKAGQMGISEQWLASVVAYMRRHNLQLITNIVGTLRDIMIALFEKATKEGWGYEVVARKLLSEGIAKRRSIVIARTESHRGAMAGSIEGARSLPYVVRKEWLSASDTRVRREPRDQFDHKLLSGQQQELDVPFVNEEKLMFPGDPEASAGNTIQCRCVMNFIPQRDSDGMLILK